MSGPLLVMFAQVRPDHLGAFTALEDELLVLLAEHGLLLRSRYRGDDCECHVIEIPDEPALQRYLADPRRTPLTEAIAELDVQQSVYRVREIAPARFPSEGCGD